MISNFLLCGVGGQGTVLASKLIAAAAMKNGLEVKTAETIGMSQRGGCVVSHVRVGSSIHSPLIPLGKADVMIAFEPAEAVRCLPYLKKDGAAVVSIKPVIPVGSALTGDYSSESAAKLLDYLKTKTGKLTEIDPDELVRLLGSAKTVNVAMLGAAVRSEALPVTVKDLEEVVPMLVKPQFAELNLYALRIAQQL